jgi:alpha-aminoadipic semialdehyde synthase
LVAFGRYAGIAGAFDFFRGIGEFFLQKKLQTPFIFMGSTYMYEDYDAMKAALASVARNIAKSGTPKHLGPLVFAVTGTGRVADGILEVLEQLPHVKVDPDELKNLESIVGKDTKKIIISQFASKHMVKHKEGHAFNKSDYYAHPQNYETKYAEEYLEHVHFFINGVYWEAKYPRIMSINEVRDGVLAGKSKLLGVCDISADYMGSVEFTSRFTSIEHPFLLYDPITEEFSETMDEMKENSILFHSVDHLPAEMPKEASNHFGEQLMPFVRAVAFSNPNLPFADQVDLPAEIRNAVICSHGELTPKYQYITELRRIREVAK